MSRPEPKPCEKFRNDTTVSPEFIHHITVEKCPKGRVTLADLQDQAEIRLIAWQQRN